MSSSARFSVLSSHFALLRNEIRIVVGTSAETARGYRVDLVSLAQGEKHSALHLKLGNRTVDKRIGSGAITVSLCEGSPHLSVSWFPLEPLPDEETPLLFVAKFVLKRSAYAMTPVISELPAWFEISSPPWARDFFEQSEV